MGALIYRRDAIGKLDKAHHILIMPGVESKCVGEGKTSNKKVKLVLLQINHFGNLALVFFLPFTLHYHV